MLHWWCNPPWSQRNWNTYVSIFSSVYTFPHVVVAPYCAQNILPADQVNEAVFAWIKRLHSWKKTNLHVYFFYSNSQLSLCSQLHNSVRGEALFSEVLQIPGELYLSASLDGSGKLTCELGGGLRNVTGLQQSKCNYHPSYGFGVLWSSALSLWSSCNLSNIFSKTWIVLQISISSCFELKIFSLIRRIFFLTNGCTVWENRSIQFAIYFQSGFEAAGCEDEVLQCGGKCATLKYQRQHKLSEVSKSSATFNNQVILQIEELYGMTCKFLL